MTLAPAIDDPMNPTCENCNSSNDIGLTAGTDVVLCKTCSISALKILAGWKGWPPKPPVVARRSETTPKLRL